MVGRGNSVTILGISLLSVILLGGFAFEDAFAADISWDGGDGTSNNWSDADNWDGDTLPTGADNISIVNDCPSLINFNVSPFTLSSTKTLTIGASCDVQGVDIINQGTIDVFGNFRPSGNFDNQGTMNVNTAKLVQIIGLNTQNSGQITITDGNIVIASVTSKFTNTGTITNNDKISLAGSTSVLLNQGTIVGTGTISNGGTIVEDCGSSITGQTISGSGTTTNVCAETIDFEDDSFVDLAVVGIVGTATNDVTFTVGDCTDINPGTPAFIAQVGGSRTAFVPADNPVGTSEGSFFVTDENISVNTIEEDYCILFANPVSGISLDAYDFRADGGGEVGNTVTLRVFSDSFTTEVGSDIFTVLGGEVDGNVVRFVVGNPSDPITSAILDYGLDDGTGIDNISFTLADITPPTMDSAITATTTTIDVTFSEDLNAGTVAGSDFTVDNGGSALAVSGVAVSNEVVTLTVATFGTGDKPTVTLVDTAGIVEDVAGNALTGDGTAASDVVATDGVAPVISSSATVTTQKIDVTFSEDLDGTTVVAGDFTVAGETISTASEDSAGVVTITLSSTMGTGDKPTVTLVDTAGIVFDDDGNALTGDGTPASDVVATDGVAPTMDSAKTASTTTIDVTFSEDMDAIAPGSGGSIAPTDFTVDNGGSALAVSGVAVSNEVVTLTVATFGTGDKPTVTLFAPTGIVEDDDGNALTGDGSSTFNIVSTDGVPPVLSTLTVASNNADTTLAKAGNTVTISFVSSEALAATAKADVKIDGKDATTAALAVGNTGITATRTMLAADTQGPIAFTIDFADNDGNNAVALVDQGDVTTGTTVTFDSVNPSITLPPTVNREKLASLTITESTNTITPAFVTAPVTGLTSGSLTYTMEATRNPGSFIQYTVTSSDATTGVATFSCDSAGAQANVDGSSAIPGADSSAANTAGQDFAVGSTIVTCTSTDEAGNQNSDTMTFTVEDKTAPIVLGPFEITHETVSSFVFDSTVNEAANDGSTTATPGTPAKPKSASEPRAYTIEAVKRAGVDVTFIATAFDLVEVTFFTCTTTGFSPIAATLTETGGEVTIDNGGQTLPITNYISEFTSATCTGKDAAGNGGVDGKVTTTFGFTVEDTTPPILLPPENPDEINDIVGVLTGVDIDIGFGPGPGGSFAADLVSVNGILDGTAGTIAISDTRNDPATPECSDPDGFTCFEPLTLAVPVSPGNKIIWTALDTAGFSTTEDQIVTINPTGSPIVIGYFENTVSGPAVNNPVSVNLDDGRQVQVTDYRGNQDRTETEVLRFEEDDPFSLESSSLSGSGPNVFTALIETGPDTGVFRTQLPIEFEGGIGPSVDDAFIAIVPAFNPNAQVLEDDELNVTPTDTVTSHYISADITSVYGTLEVPIPIPQRSLLGIGSDTADGTVNVGCIGCGSQLDIPAVDNSFSIAPAFRVNESLTFIIRDTFFLADTSDNSLIPFKIQVINNDEHTGSHAHAIGDSFFAKLTEDFPDDQGALYPLSLIYLSSGSTSAATKTLHVEEGDTVTIKYTFDNAAFGSPTEDVTVDIIGTISQEVSDSSGVSFIAGSNCIADQDGDGLCSEWETSAGLLVNSTYFLPCGPGTEDPVCPDPNRKDIYVEYDYMFYNQPSIEALNIAVTTFDQGRTKNPGGALGQSASVNAGVALHMISSERMPQSDWVEFMPFVTTGGVLGFHDRKTLAITPDGTTGFFGQPWERAGTLEDGTPTGFTGEELITAKRQAFHYMMFIAEQADNPGSSGTAEIGGNDVLISMADFTSSSGSSDEVGATIVHELGHNLGLRHGGGELNNYNCKPNYISVMNYAFQFDVEGLDRKVDFSRKTMATLDTNALIESSGIQRYWYPQWNEGTVHWTGVGTNEVQNSRYAGSLGESIIVPTGIGVDWDGDGLGVGGIEDASSPSSVPGITDFAEIGDCGPVSAQLLGYEDWANLDFNFRDNAQFASGDSVQETPATQATLAEIFSQIVNPALEEAGKILDIDCRDNLVGALQNIKDGIVTTGKSRSAQVSDALSGFNAIEADIADGTICFENIEDPFVNAQLAINFAQAGVAASNEGSVNSFLDVDTIDLSAPLDDSEGEFDVTIFGKPGFDVTNIIPESLFFGPATDPSSGASPFVFGNLSFDFDDIDGDGIADMHVTDFKMAETDLDPADNDDKVDGKQLACLIGTNEDGSKFRSCHRQLVVESLLSKDSGFLTNDTEFAIEIGKTMFIKFNTDKVDFDDIKVLSEDWVLESAKGTFECTEEGPAGEIVCTAEILLTCDVKALKVGEIVDTKLQGKIEDNSGGQFQREINIKLTNEGTADCP